MARPKCPKRPERQEETGQNNVQNHLSKKSLATDTAKQAMHTYQIDRCDASMFLPALESRNWSQHSQLEYQFLLWKGLWEDMEAFTTTNPKRPGDVEKW